MVVCPQTVGSDSKNLNIPIDTKTRLRYIVRQLQHFCYPLPHYRKKIMTKNEIPTIPESSWEILNILWRRGPCSASQIAGEIAETAGWSLGTVRSYLSRLVAKGIVRQLDDECIYRYEAVYDKEFLLSREQRSFLDKFYDGTLCSMVAHYLGNEKVSRDEIDRLQTVIDAAKKKNEQIMEP